MGGLVLILRREGRRRDAAQRSHKRRCTRGGEADDSRSSVMRGVSGAHGEEFEQEEEARSTGQSTRTSRSKEE